jgi:NitT/TauT family transport system ATP-binding protein
MTAVLRVENVSKLYEASNGAVSWALQNVSLSVAAGEFICAIGPSGCGKTTLLNLIAGFMTPTSGTMTLDGRPIPGPGPDRGVVFQEYALFPWLTARRNIEFGLEVRGVPSKERAAASLEFIRLVGLERAADLYPYELSGGMRQRIAVARALVNRPRLLLMDEPFAALDSMTRLTLQMELLRIWQTLELGVIFITHNIEEAVFLSQRIVVMSPHPGRIKCVLQVDLPFPRDRADPAFGRVYSEVRDAFES